MKIFQKGSVYIIALIFIFLTALFAAGILLITSIEHRNVIRDQWSLTALLLAEAGAEDAIWALKNDDWTTGGWTTTGNPYTKTVSSFRDSTATVIGSYYVTVTNPTSSTPTIESTGYSPDNSASDRRERTIKITASNPDDSNIVAAITTNDDTTTLGTMDVDGRNHDTNGNLISPGGTGTWGVWTTGDYTQSGSSEVGGTSTSDVDYAPSNPAESSVISENNPPGSYPTTPDEVLNYSDGVLKSRAQSGKNGSQYVTDVDDLTFPLSGVTYVEISGTWNATSDDLDGSTGIVVVHSPTGYTADIKNLNPSTGTFKGLIIADNVDKIHCTIIGAVFTLSNNVTADCIGNGSGSVLYSSEAIDDAIDAAGGLTLLTWQEK